MFRVVFFSGGLAAPDVPLLFVQIQNGSDLLIQKPVIFLQSLGKIFVDRRFGYSEFPCRSAYSGTGFDDVHSQFSGPYFDVVCHMFPSDAVSCREKHMNGVA